MRNFYYHNPTKLIVGQNQISQLPQLLSTYQNILIIIDKNVDSLHNLTNLLQSLLSAKTLRFFYDIQINSEITQISLASNCGREMNCDFILAIGGGSIIDAAKFVSCAINYPEVDLWQIMLKTGYDKVINPIDMGIVTSYPSAGSEMNPYFVASNKYLHRKIACYAPMVTPQFAILDASLTQTLSTSQLAIGIVDSFSHVLEQFLVANNHNILQNHQSLSLLETLISLSKSLVTKIPVDQSDSLQNLQNLMLTSTLALNGLIECGITSDWTSHWLSHELTALYDIPHAQAVMLIMPSVLQYTKNFKHDRLLQYAQQIWLSDQSLSVEQQIDYALTQTWDWVNSLGIKTCLRDYGIFQLDNERIINNVFNFTNEQMLGEINFVDRQALKQILNLAVL